MEDDPEFHLTSYGDVRTYVDTLESLREAAFDNPLTAGTTFTLVLKQVTLHPHGRPLPRFAAQLPETGAVYSVILDRVLQTGSGCDAWGQVWLACVTDPASPDQVLGNIVVKLVQPSLLYHPDPTSFYQMYWTSPKKVAYTEDWAYRKLRSIQGCEIPYYYGMQTVVTPSGECAWILAMEYVEGQTICQWLDSSHNKDSGGSLIPKDLTPEMFKKLKTLASCVSPSLIYTYD
ncbi:hypothetical protein PLICRDRAFT_373325 [Plicaturopsis crispa FD-325 SS-3]|uniref:Protein kinase domain-containing protein n=1 Tax=Plicaturopsis crispa FD-325 SS-3 TaxID=944288 RepID=A0A0C9SX72_PLICR|nr:hypothetical protein PLICRDRAFT_373325 [Plicaturopsis crispa FD-325 SS-3]